MKNLPAPFQVIAQALRDWWDDWINQVVIAIVWLLCWLTVVPGPPATLGLYYVANRLAHGDSLGLRGLVQGARRYFVKSWQWALLNLAALLVLAVDLTFYGQIQAAWAGFLQGIFIILGLLWLLVQFYALPFLMEQEQKSLKLALRNGLFLALSAPGYTLVLACIAALLLLFCAVLILPLFLGFPGLFAAIGNRAVIERLATYGVHERQAAQKQNPDNQE
jgi:uncharacterized membrane protein YesL